MMLLKTKKHFRGWFLLCACLFLSGCGYHISGIGGTLPGAIQSLSIPVFANSTAKPGIEAGITTAFVNEFVTTVHIADDADARLTGEIRSYELTPVSYTKKDVSQEYRLKVAISLRMLSSDGRVLWQEDNIEDYEDFQVNASDISATRDAEMKAFKKLSSDTARLVKERMLEGF